MEATSIEVGLPLTHFEPMSVMDRLGVCRVYDIATELGITTGGVSKLIDRIEASSPSDRLRLRLRAGDSAFCRYPR